MLPTSLAKSSLLWLWPFAAFFYTQKSFIILVLDRHHGLYGAAEAEMLQLHVIVGKHTLNLFLERTVSVYRGQNILF